MGVLLLSWWATGPWKGGACTIVHRSTPNAYSSADLKSVENGNCRPP
jgi:hypothetical protein